MNENSFGNAIFIIGILLVEIILIGIIDIEFKNLPQQKQEQTSFQERYWECTQQDQNGWEYFEQPEDTETQIYFGIPTYLDEEPKGTICFKTAKQEYVSSEGYDYDENGNFVYSVKTDFREYCTAGKHPTYKCNKWVWTFNRPEVKE